VEELPLDLEPIFGHGRPVGEGDFGEPDFWVGAGLVDVVGVEVVEALGSVLVLSAAVPVVPGAAAAPAIPAAAPAVASAPATIVAPSTLEMRMG